MTLVVARRWDDRLVMAADSLLTRPGATHVEDLFAGELKIVLLNAQTAVGVAESQAAARGAVRAMQSAVDRGEPFDGLVAIGADATTNAEGSLELIVALLRPFPRLVRVRHGVAEEVTGGQTWIGDRDAFSAFQHRAHAAALNHPGAEAMMALQAIIDDPAHATVGGVLVSAITVDEGLAYSCSLRAHPEMMTPQRIPDRTWTVMQFGQGAAEGSFTQAVLTPFQAGLGIVAVYVYEAAAGAVIWPARFDDPQIIRAETQEEFASQVDQVFGVHVAAPTLT